MVIVGIWYGNRAFSGSGLLQGYPAVEAALGFMLPALFMSFLLASFQRKQSLCVTAALVGALAGVTLFLFPSPFWQALSVAASLR